MFVFSQISLGVIMSAIGVLLPGLINMGSVNECIKKGLKSGIGFSLGASVAIFLQALLAVTFAGYLGEHPEVFKNLKRISVAVFLLLALFFIYQARKKRESQNPPKKGRAFFKGFVIANMNLLNIPFYFAWSTYFRLQGNLMLDSFNYRILFSSGAFFGAFLILVAYARFAHYITSRAKNFNNNLNYFLAFLFFAIAVIQLIQLYL